MKNEFTAVYEQDEGWYVGYGLEVSGAWAGKTLNSKSVAKVLVLMIE